MLALLLLSAICARSLSEWCPCLHSQPRFPLNLPLLSTRGGTDVIHIARCNNNFQCFAARINHLVNLASRSFPTDVNGMAIFAATCCSTCCMLMCLYVCAWMQLPSRRIYNSSATATKKTSISDTAKNNKTLQETENGCLQSYYAH